MAYQQPGGKDNRRAYAAAGLFLAVSFLVLDYATFSGALTSFDVSTFILVNEGSHPWLLDVSMVLLSEYGRELVWGTVIVALLVFGHGRERKVGIGLIILFAILAPLGAAVKDLESRERPYMVLPGTHLLVGAEADPSFPSGHTLFVVGGAILSLIYLRRAMSIPLAVEASLVSFSRIYVGVHYPTDIVAGALLGGSVAFLLASQFGIVDRIGNRLSASVGPRKNKRSPESGENTLNRPRSGP